MSIGQIVVILVVAYCLRRALRSRMPAWHAVLHLEGIDHTVMLTDGHGRHVATVHHLGHKGRTVAVMRTVKYGRRICYVDLFPADATAEVGSGVRFVLDHKERFDLGDLKKYQEWLRAALPAGASTD
jgi:hypothetical protein